MFGHVYWLANWMELVERFAYYGVRVVLPVFMVAAFEQGGPELTQIQKGNIYAVWAVVQSFVPILSGGFADRYGYKLNIARLDGAEDHRLSDHGLHGVLGREARRHAACAKLAHRAWIGPTRSSLPGRCFWHSAPPSSSPACRA